MFNFVINQDSFYTLYGILPLIIPENISLLFLPPYSPELNPAEKIWQFIKRKFTNKYFQSLDEISIFFQDVIPTLEPDLIKSICGYKYISTETF